MTIKPPLLVLILFVFFKASSITFENTTWKQEAKAYGGIIGTTTLAAILYGVIHNQITARVCMEYFSEGFHRQATEKWKDVPILSSCRDIVHKSKSPTLHGAMWGVVATWWVGASLGTLLALSSRVGSWPKLDVTDLLLPLGIVFATAGISAVASGFHGYRLAKNNQVDKNFWREISSGTPEHKLNHFIAVGYAHHASYTVAALGGVALVAWSLYKRYNLSTNIEFQMAGPNNYRISYAY